MNTWLESSLLSSSEADTGAEAQSETPKPQQDNAANGQPKMKTPAQQANAAVEETKTKGEQEKLKETANTLADVNSKLEDKTPEQQAAEKRASDLTGQAVSEIKKGETAQQQQTEEKSQDSNSAPHTFSYYDTIIADAERMSHPAPEDMAAPSPIPVRTLSSDERARLSAQTKLDLALDSEDPNAAPLSVGVALQRATHNDNVLAVWSAFYRILGICWRHACSPVMSMPQICGIYWTTSQLAN